MLTASKSRLRENKIVLYFILFLNRKIIIITHIMGHGLSSVNQFVSYIVTTDTFGQESQDRQDRRSQRSKALRKAEFLSWKQKKYTLSSN